MSKLFLIFLFPIVCFANTYESILLDLERQLYDAIQQSFRDRGYDPCVIYESTPISDGWRDSQFGVFYQSNTQWIFHIELGWLYPSQCSHGYWFFSEGYGWLWGAELVFPYFYHAEQGWVYFYLQKP